MRNAIYLLSLLVSTALIAQKEATVLTVDGQNVTQAEFEAIYKKNNKDADVTKDALDEYMELFINYKLKVREAEALGMDTIGKFQTELAGYRTQLARPYLIDSELNEALLQEAYDRKGQEIRASHILVQIQGDAAPEDTLAAWNRIMALRDRVAAGEDFAIVAKAKGGSDDPSAATNGGDLGWFTALQMVYPFESAAFNTQVGELSQPVRTRFGYHIIQVVDKRPARGEITTAHIMLRSGEKDSEEKKAEVEKKIKEIYAKVLDGTDSFADLALRYSEDPGSSSKGGELPKFGTGKMVEEYENVAFGLNEDGAVSEPFTTQFGWHIVKRISYDPIPPFEEMKSQLKSRISKDSRAEMTRKSFVQRLKNEYNYQAYPKNLKKVAKLVDERIYAKGSAVMDTVIRSQADLGEVTKNGSMYDRTVHGVFENGVFINIRNRRYAEIPETSSDTIIVKETSKGWTYDRSKAMKLTKPMFTLDSVDYDQKQLLDYLETYQRSGNMPIEDTWKDDYVNTKFKEWVDREVLAYEDSKLEDKHEEFRMLMKEYRDGILLFELTDEMVWSKAVSDTTGLMEYFSAHRDEFMWPKRWDATIYKCENESIAKDVRKYLKRKWDGARILDQVNEESSLDLQIESDTYDADSMPFLKEFNATGLTENVEVDGQVVFADIKQILEPSQKELDEARGMITAAYQDHLEQEWVKALREKYSYQVNPDVLYSIQ